MRRQLIRRGLQLLTFAVVAMVWLILGWAGVLGPSNLPSLGSVVGKFVGLLHSSTAWSAIGRTVYSSLEGLVFGSVLAVPCGLAIGCLPRVEHAVGVLIDFLRSTPVLALYPVFVLVLGGTTKMLVTVSGIGVFFVVLVQTAAGARHRDPVLEETVRAYCTRRLDHLFRVTIPSSMPAIAVGIRIAASLSLLSAIAVEVLVPLPGIGYQIATSQQNAQNALAFAYIVVAALLGLGFNVVLRLAERPILGWYTRGR